MKQFLIFCIAIVLCASFKPLYSGNSSMLLSAKIISREGKSMSLAVTLSNNTSDTLRYESWDCSWQKSYLIDNDKWKIWGGMDCFKNGHKTYTIPPYQSETKVLELQKLDGISKSKNSEFRIGFQYIPPPPEVKTIPAKQERFPPRGFVVWSNKMNVSLFSKKDNPFGK